MEEVFFDATIKALNNITVLFDSVWPTVVGLWNLRCSVKGVKSEFPSITESQLAAKFALGSGIHGVNFKRAFVEKSWEEQQRDFAWTILNSSFPIFEGWLEELKADVFPSLDTKAIQFPVRIKSHVAAFTATQSTMLTHSLYPVYLTKRNRCYSQIDALMYCYRVFKEARNCYMHNGSKADQKLIDAYNAYSPYATTSALCVAEVPVFLPPSLNQDIAISLRGVVGFSDILRKIIISLDTELMKSSDAEAPFISRCRERHPILKTLEADAEAAKSQAKSYVIQCGYPTPISLEEVVSFLRSHHLVN